jgi:hypothetical protein
VHYTVDVLHQNGDSGGGEAWLHIDDEALDEAVSAAPHEDIFRGQDNERVDKHTWTNTHLARRRRSTFTCKFSSTEKDRA